MTSPLADGTATKLRAVQWRAAWIGVGASGLCLLGGLWNIPQFFHSYLIAFVFWLGVALGCLALTMLHHLTSGAWGIVIRRLLEAGMGTLPWFAVLFIPLVFGLRSIYQWTSGGVPAGLSSYLNAPFFVLRAALYFASWIWLARLLGRWSERQDKEDSTAMLQRMRQLSAPGMVLYGFTASFAAIDWIMSLDPG